MFGRKLINLSHVISVRFVELQLPKKIQASPKVEGGLKTGKLKLKLTDQRQARTLDMGSRHGHGHGDCSNFATRLQAPNF